MRTVALRVAWIAGVLAAVGLTLPAAAQVTWRSGETAFQVATPAEIQRTVTDALAAGTRHVVVELTVPAGAMQRAEFAGAGVELLSYLGNQTFFAALAPTVDPAALANLTTLRAVQNIALAWKLDPALIEDRVPDYALVSKTASGDDVVGLYVVFHPDVPVSGAGVDIALAHEAMVRAELLSINALVIELPRANIDALALEDGVQWVELPLPRMSVTNDSNRAITQADDVNDPPYNLDGSGITVLVYDGGYARASHVDFQGRLTVRDSSGMADHSTHVCGTIGGAGVANSNYRGMAPGVTIESYGFEYDGSDIFLYSNPGDMEDDYDEAIHSYGADIANNSIGTNTAPNGFPCDITGNYGVTSQLIDTIVRGDGSNPLFDTPFRIVWANGNERQTSRCGDTYATTAPPACAKNHITVGALNSNDDSVTSFTSWGPADDGRLKPDISGPGCQSNGDGGVTSCSYSSDTAYTVKCGTSMASPTVTGLLSLLLEDFRAQFPALDDPRNSTLKVLLAHNAEDIQNAGPDYQSGYGSVRIKDTIDFMRSENWFEGQTDQGDTYSVLVSVSAGDSELKVTLAWDDVPGTPNVNPALVNDLDLRVYDPSNGRHYPWTLDPGNPSAAAVRNQEDHVNNIEQVYVSSPATGIWRVEVYGYDVPDGPQSFSLCASPQLVACSSQGTIALDAASYGCSGSAQITVIDCDLNANDSVVETINVSIASDSESGGETVQLSETGPATAEFAGSITLSLTNSSGVLQVAHGDTITATYIDADDGQGGHNVTVTANASVDCEGPVISNVQVAQIGSSTATITFDTDKSANGTIRYGLSCGALPWSESEGGYSTSHSIELTGLSFNTQYFFAVDAVDTGGNPSTDDNGGACYSFSTPNVVYDFPMDTNPGWSTEGLWAFGTPTGGGGQYGNPDPDSGYTGSNVYGYNLSGDYENSLPERNLTTTALNCTGLSDVTLKFRRWLNVEQPSYDHAYLRVSNNGSSWTTLWENTVEVTDSSWVLEEYDISAIADNQATVYLRWTMGTTDGSWQYSGWNLDDVQIIAVGGGGPTCDDGILNQGEDRIDCGGPCPACECTSDGACSDGTFCNGTETCDAHGECQSGSDPCTGQYCDEGSDQCVECLNDGHCNDGLYCNGAETCSGGSCQAGTAIDCNDGVGCTDDSCNEGTDSCDHAPNNGVCDNGLYCDGVETCDPVADCQPGTAIDCNDGVACTVDSCNEGTDSCANLPDDGLCADGQFCNGAETCDAELGCQAGSDPCPGQICDEDGDQCLDCVGDGDCDDGEFCNGAETCEAGTCQPGSDPCPGQACDEGSDTCVDCLGDGDCDDGEFCNGAETCEAGTCQPGSDPCPGQFCREDSDDCADCLEDAHCDDGNPCNGVETCDVPAGTCQAGSCDTLVYLIDENFDSDAGDFTYQDDVFGTNNPNYATGTYESSGGYSGGAVRTYLGPGDIVNPASGGWWKSFSLSEDATVTVTLRFRMLLGEGYETNEYGETVLTINGTRYGNDTNDSLVHVIGNGNGGGVDDTGWLYGEFEIPLSAGPQTVTVGAYNNDATYSDEYVEVFIDDLTISATLGSECECDDGVFCNGEETCVDGMCEPGSDPCPGQMCDEDADACVDCLNDGDCDDGLWCNGSETCTGGACQPGSDPCPGQMCNEDTDACVECLNDGDCDDGLWCNGAETCDGSGDCQPGTRIDCDDGVECTVDSCNEDTDACDNVPDDMFCDNGLYCDGVETCDPVMDCQAGVEVDCDDGVECTVDSCNEDADSCDNVPDDLFCDNGLYCDGVETCDPVMDCQAGVEVDCDDGVECTVDSCNEDADSCDNVPDDLFCDNGLYCDGVETCDPVMDCQAGVEVDCDDGVECTVDSCNEDADSCDNVPDDLFCDNGLYCDGVETCDPVMDCQAGVEVDCDDGVECTVDSCNEDTDACDNVPDDLFCDNGLYCDGVETCDPVMDCQAGVEVDCDDGVECTVDSCNEDADSCDNVPDDLFCDNGLYCDGVETCDPVMDCQAGVEVDCDDGVECTVDSCNEDTDACDNVPDDMFCDNGLYCDGVETCDPVMDCQAGVEVDCDDGVECTVDSCNEDADSCDNVPDDLFCDNGLYCDGVETCDPVMDCQAGVEVDCDDGVECTVDSCNEDTDACDNVPDDLFCDNGLYCDGVETCDPVMDCQAGVEVDCDDGVECTVDSCNEDADACDNVPDDMFCDNGLYCDGVETCDPELDCQSEGYPCSGDEWCDESSDDCVAYGAGDFDGDSDVDLLDLAAFQTCFGLEGAGFCAPGNLAGDDAQIDLEDLAAFVLLLTGP